MFLLRLLALAVAFVPVAGDGDALAAPPLVDMRGAAIDATHGVTILSFFYTRCPDPRMCPLVTAKFRRMAAALDGTPIRLVELTLDPADTPAVLRRYAAATGADGRRWTLAAGEPQAVTAFAERLGLVVDRPRPGAIVHSEAVVIARDGVVARNVPGNDWTAEQIAAEARAVAALPADPLARLALRAFGGLAALCGAAGARGITPAATILIFLTLLGAAGWLARRLYHRMVAAP
jgi:cytochrome oxidase Cu insertion factor (SCO1/SenC/PrrC family)